VVHVLYRPAIRRQGEIETFAQSKMMFPTEEAANAEANRLRNEWNPRFRGELETVLLVEVEEEASGDATHIT
jgi:hypothetical protein